MAHGPSSAQHTGDKNMKTWRQSLNDSSLPRTGWFIMDISWRYHGYIMTAFYSMIYGNRVDVTLGAKWTNIQHPKINHFSGWWFEPLWKIFRQLGWLFPIYGKIKNVPNHQPVFVHGPSLHSLHQVAELPDAHTTSRVGARMADDFFIDV